MKVFKQSARLFKLFCCVTPDYTNKWKNRGCHLNASLYLLCSFLAGWSSYLFFTKSLSVSKEDAFCALYQLVVVVGPLTTYFVAQYMKKDIENNFADYQNFYDQNKDMDPMGFMQKAEKSGRKMVKILSLGFGSAALSMNLLTGFGSLFYLTYKHGNLINYAEVHRPYRYVVPWDQNTLIGWMGVTMFSVFLPVYFFSNSSGYASLLVTICEYHISFCKIVNCQITNIDDVVRRGKPRIADLRKMYDKTVSFHLAAKELFVKTDDIYCYFIAVELFHFMYFTTFIIFHYDHAIRHLNLHFALMTVAMVYGLTVLYFYSYYGQRATDSYSGIADHLYESNWMHLPLGLQRMYVLMIAHAQKELYFRGLGMVDLKRETFLRVGRTIVGYVLMFKTMAESS